MSWSFANKSAKEQPAASANTMESIYKGYFLNVDSLVKSLTSPELYGDERDQIIARLNQIAAALGVGSGFYKEGQTVTYTVEGPFHRFKSVCYNMVSEFTEADGVVSLIVNTPVLELSTSAQKQQIIDKLFQIIGGGPNFPVKLNGIKAIDDRQTEVNIFVVNKSSGTPTPSSTLAKFLSEPAKKTQLEQQLKVDKIIARFSMDKYQKERFVKEPPAGIDDALWQQACRENPDPDRLLPYPIRGFDQLLVRQKTQNSETEIAGKVIDNLMLRLRELSSIGELSTVKATQQKVIQKQLSHRLLRILCMDLIQERFNQPIDTTEENIKAVIEIIDSKLNAPMQIKESLIEMGSAIRSNEVNKETSKKSNLSENDLVKLQKYLSRCQDGLDSLSNIVQENLRNLSHIAGAMGLNESSV